MRNITRKLGIEIAPAPASRYSVHAECEFEIWNGVVEYTHAVIQAVRSQAVEGFTSFGHGGLEIGGVLYGERRGDVVRVLEAVELECEHALGPGFVLSEKDEAGFRELSKPRDGMRAVGWYCSHTRTGMALNTNDCAIMERFFGQPGSVALLMKPTRLGSAEATFYLQGVAEPGPHFSVAPEPPAAEAEVEAAEALTVGDAVPLPPAPIADAGKGAVSPMPPVWLWPGVPLLRWAVLGLALAACGAWFISTGPGTSAKSAGTRLGLQVYSIANRQVRIEWDRQAAAVRSATAGTVEIVDGANHYTLPLNAEQLRASSLTFGRETDMVEVRMKLAGGPEETAQVVAPSTPRLAKVASGAPPPPAVALAAAPAEAGVDENPVEPREAPRVKDRAPLKRFQLAAAERPPEPDRGVTLPDPPLALAAAALPKLLPPIAAATLTAPSPIRTQRSGRMIWTGSLARRGVVEIEGATATVGSLSGGLPAVAAKLSVLPAEFTHNGLVVYLNDAARHNLTEPPGPLTGWNRLHFVWAPERLKQISVLEAPNPSNQYARLALRNEGKPCAVIVVEWRVE